MDNSAPVTLKIPRPLYNKLQQLVAGTSFRSVTEFVIYVLRDLASSEESAKEVMKQEPDPGYLTEQEVEIIRKRLQRLGYL